MTDAVETKSSPVITSANLPKPPAPAASPTAVVHDDDIVAKPLGSGFRDIRPANPAMSLRWINRVAGSGARFDQAKAEGYHVCHEGDISKETPPAAHWKKDGAFIDGDLILMMMPKVDYIGAIKQNEQNAVRRLSHVNTLEFGKGKMGEALNEVPGSAANKAKIKLYNPGA